MPPESRSPNRPAPPEHLAGEALLEWERVCDELEAAGRLALVDRAVLTLYVETWADWRDASRRAEPHGQVIVLPNKFPGPNPWQKQKQDLGKALIRLLGQMELTPATRVKSAANLMEPDDLLFE